MQARARVGYALGGVLPYVAFGIAQSEASIVGTPFSEGLDGMSFGLGVEYMLNEQISMRVDYTSATVDTDVVGPFPPGYEATINMISIGAAFHF